MALTSEQKSSRLFKKLVGAGETLIGRDFFEEGFLGKSTILPSQIWAQAAEIPTVAPTLSNDGIEGVVRYHMKLSLTHVPGAEGRSFYSLDLKDCIPFNYHKTYNYKLYTSAGDVIPDGLKDWLVDTEAGLLTFYADTLPAGVSAALPPKISFYKYVGTKGLSGDAINNLSTAISSEVSNRSTADVSLTSRISIEELVRSTADVSLTNELSITTSIAKGAQKAISFADYSAMVTYLLSVNYAGLNIGQSIYINTIDVPDIWISGQPLTPVAYTYTNDSELISGVNSGGGKLQIGYTTISFLETQKVNLTNYATTTALSTAISSESSLRLDMDGAGLSYDNNSRLQVNVDDYTISIVGGELRTPETWMEFDSKTTILDSVTNGSTNIVLDYDPVGYISAYINGIEYMVSSTTLSATGQPFYFDTPLPTTGSKLYFNAVEAGFGLESGVDMIMVKYHYINNKVLEIPSTFLINGASDNNPTLNFNKLDNTELKVVWSDGEVYTTSDIGDVSIVKRDSINYDVIASVYCAGEYGLNSSCAGSSVKKVVLNPSVTNIGFSAFRDCSSLTSIVIPDSVTNIGHGAFSGCISLTSIVIPDSVTSLGSAFDGCTNLTSIVIGNSVTNIDNIAFYNCTSLTSVTIGNSVTVIGDNAFYNCTSLTSIVIPDSVTNIGDYAFSSCTDLTSIVIPDSVTNIGDYAFSGCISLTSIVIPDSVTNIDGGAFTNCSSLTSIVIPDSVTNIGGGAFSNCISLTSVTIGNSVTNIGTGTFSSCANLTSIVIPDSVTNIGGGAFNGCESLKTYYFYPLVALTVEIETFSYNIGVTLHIPSTSTGYDVSPWTDTSKFATITKDL